MSRWTVCPGEEPRRAATLVYEHPGGPISLGDWSLDGRWAPHVLLLRRDRTERVVRDSGERAPGRRTFGVATGAGTQVTSTVNIAEQTPVWLPDGEHVAYSYFEEDHSWIARKAADSEYVTFESFGFVATVPLGGGDPLAREAVEPLREEFEVNVPRFSPDGRFVAYTYNESGRPEAYFTGFDGTTGMAAEGPSGEAGFDVSCAGPYVPVSSGRDNDRMIRNRASLGVVQ